MTASQKIEQQNKTLANKDPTCTLTKDRDKWAAWFNLLVHLDPLADPDAVGCTMPGAEDHNCWMLVNQSQDVIITQQFFN
jgi:Islet cell autoantigen ICA69, C-terminal domain.